MRAAPLLLFIAVGVSGCVPAYEPKIAAVDNRGLGLAAAVAKIDPRWWQAYRDPQLDRLMALGLSNNPNLDSALARLEAARAETHREQAKLLPQINGLAEVDRSLIGDKLLPAPIGGHAATLGLAGASLDWDLDLFGRQHALLRKAGADAAAKAYDLAAAQLALSVTIAQTYVDLQSARQQIKVIDGIVATRSQSLALVKSRQSANLVGDIDVAANETLVAEAEQASTRATRDRDVLIHALATLVGRGADFYGAIEAPVLALDRAPDVPKILSADLLGRRPDLLAARLRINAAIGNRQAAAAAFMPDINITTLGGLAAFGLSNVFAPGAGSYLAGPALSLPIFEGGRLRAEYKEATDDLDGSVADYNTAVLTAIREAADAITNVHEADKDLAEQLRVVAGFRNTVRLDQVRVSSGLGSKLDAIDSGFRLLQAEQDLIRLRANALTTRIALIAALGGGFSSPANTALASEE